VPLLAGYHRPETLDEAVALLSQPQHIPLAGGTVINADRHRSGYVGVDLQSLGLNNIQFEGSSASVGAMVRVADIEHTFPHDLLGVAARRELPSTLRTLGTIGGAVAAAGQESLLLAALLASSATVTTADGKSTPLDEFLRSPNGLITTVELHTSTDWAFEHTGRTPMDTPIVAVAGRRSSSGPILAITGVSSVPELARSLDEVEQLIPFSDFRGSSEYRHHLAVKLSQRVLGALS